MTVLVLIGGGNSSGKQTYSHKIKHQLLELVPTLKIDEINLEEKYYNLGIPLQPDAYKFDQLITDINQLTSDVVIVNGIYVLYNKILRMKLSLKIFIDCDNDTRLTRYIQKNSPTTNENLSKIIATHLLTRSDLIGRTDSDIILKTNVSDDPKNKISVELIINYLIDLLNNNGIGISDTGEINLRENIERFYELN